LVWRTVVDCWNCGSKLEVDETDLSINFHYLLPDIFFNCPICAARHGTNRNLVVPAIVRNRIEIKFKPLWEDYKKKYS